MIESVAKVKHNSIVYYKRFLRKKYNEKSKSNLVQNTQSKSHSLYKKLLQKSEFDDINAYVKTLEMAKIQETGQPIKKTLSKQQAQKISEITNVFIQTILSSYKPKHGFKQRTVTFALLTIPTEKQRIADKTIIRQLAKFIDDIKTVKNYIIDPVTKQQTKETALQIENYIWRAETTENGSIHFHILFDTFVNKNTLKRVWNNHLEKLGFERSYNSAHIHSLKSVKDVGAYVTKYLTKQPLRDKYKNMTKEQLQNVPDSEKYRRPIIGKSWGCSRAVMKLKYIDFVESDQSHLNELTDKMKEYVSEKLPEFVRVFVGNVRSCIKKCTIKYQQKINWMLKNWYQRQFKILYPEPVPILESITIHKPIKYIQTNLF